MPDAFVRELDMRTYLREQRLVPLGEPMLPLVWLADMTKMRASVEWISETISEGPQQGYALARAETLTGTLLYLVSPAALKMVKSVVSAQDRGDAAIQAGQLSPPARDRGLADRPSGDLPPEAGQAVKPGDPNWLTTPPTGVTRWEYLTTFLEADAKARADFLSTVFEGHRFAKYAPEALMSTLMTLGGAGWDLVHMEPVYPGENRDVMTHNGNQIGQWSHTYFCVFKRPRYW